MVLSSYSIDYSFRDPVLLLKYLHLRLQRRPSFKRGSFCASEDSMAATFSRELPAQSLKSQLPPCSIIDPQKVLLSPNLPHLDFL